MAIPFEDSINRTTNAPKWTDEKVADTTVRDAISSTLRYEGMIVYCIADKKTYQLQGGITNADWKEFGGAGGFAIPYIDTFTATASQTAFVLTEEPGAKQNIIGIQIDGVMQQYASYSLATKTVTLAAQDAGAIVEVRYFKPATLADVVKLKVPKFTEYGSGFSGNHNFAANTKVVYVEGWGAGGSGTGSARGSANDMGEGSNGGATTASGTNISLSFGGGVKAVKRVSLPPTGGAGGVCSFSGSAVLNSWQADGNAGEHGTDGIYGRGGRGGGSLMGMMGGRGGGGQLAGETGVYGTGGGGGGGTGEGGSQGFTGGGGGGGAFGGCWFYNPPATLSITIGSGGTNASAGTAGYLGRGGGEGGFRIWEWE